MIDKKPKLGCFNGDSNPEVWVYQAEQYFIFHGISKDIWLSLPYIYFVGEARAWFDWLYHNNRFFDWKHFTEKLVYHYRKLITTDLPATKVPPFSDLLLKMDENLFLTRRHLNNIQNNMSACSQKFTEVQGCSDVTVSTHSTEEDPDSEIDSNLPTSSPVDDSLVLAELLENPISNSSYIPVEISNDCLGTYPLESKNAKEKRTRDHACEVFAEIPDRQINLEIDDMILKTSVTIETQVFRKLSQSFSVVTCDPSALIIFSNQPALPFMLFIRSKDQLIDKSKAIYLSELGQETPILLFHEFPPDRIPLDFSFDPGSYFLMTYFGSSRNFLSYTALDCLKPEKLVLLTIWRTFKSFQFSYIIPGHVGWGCGYFLSIQRVTSCSVQSIENILFTVTCGPSVLGVWNTRIKFKTITLKVHSEHVASDSITKEWLLGLLLTTREAGNAIFFVSVFQTTGILRYYYKYYGRTLFGRISSDLPAATSYDCDAPLARGKNVTNIEPILLVKISAHILLVYVISQYLLSKWPPYRICKCAFENGIRFYVKKKHIAHSIDSFKLLNYGAPLGLNKIGVLGLGRIIGWPDEQHIIEELFPHKWSYFLELWEVFNMLLAGNSYLWDCLLLKELLGIERGIIFQDYLLPEDISVYVP